MKRTWTIDATVKAEKKALWRGYYMPWSHLYRHSLQWGSTRALYSIIERGGA